MSLSETGHPIHAIAGRASACSRSRWCLAFVRRRLGIGPVKALRRSAGLSDGLGCFVSIAKACCNHQAEVCCRTPYLERDLKVAEIDGSFQFISPVRREALRTRPSAAKCHRCGWRRGHDDFHFARSSGGRPGWTWGHRREIQGANAGALCRSVD